MTSIIDAFNSSSRRSFSFSSSTPADQSFQAERALDKEGYGFVSTDSDSFWQISFSQPVLIESYIISGDTKWGAWPTSWEISYSLNNSSFITKQTDGKDFRGNTEKFPINPPIYCKHFKITGKTTNYPDCPKCLAFYRFDCFGSLIVIKEKTCRKNFAMNQFIKNLLISLMIPFSPL